MVLDVRTRSRQRHRAPRLILALIAEIIEVIANASVPCSLSLWPLHDSGPILWLTGYRRILDLIPSVLGPVLVAAGTDLWLRRLDHKRVLSHCLACPKLNV